MARERLQQPEWGTETLKEAPEPGWSGGSSMRVWSIRRDFRICLVKDKTPFKKVPKSATRRVPVR